MKSKTFCLLLIFNKTYFLNKGKKLSYKKYNFFSFLFFSFFLKKKPPTGVANSKYLLLLQLDFMYWYVLTCDTNSIRHIINNIDTPNLTNCQIWYNNFNVISFVNRATDIYNLNFM